jgi:hypothetical protein
MQRSKEEFIRIQGRRKHFPGFKGGKKELLE